MDTNNRLAIVYIEDPDVVRESPRGVLMKLYDLTQAESEILVGIVNGLSVSDVAEMRGVTTGTTREQLKGTSKNGEFGMDCGV
jgi:DNA-binding NarL/FixJ family response regulator